MATTFYVYGYGNDDESDAIAKAALVWQFPHELLSKATTPLLRGVDPYDDTTFNRKQCGHLLNEVRFLLTQDLSPEQRRLVQELALLIGVVVYGQPHWYLRFKGD